MVELYRYYFFSSFLLVSEVLSPIKKKKIIDLNNKYFFFALFIWPPKSQNGHSAVTVTHNKKQSSHARPSHSRRAPPFVGETGARDPRNNCSGLLWNLFAGVH